MVVVRRAMMLREGRISFSLSVVVHTAGALVVHVSSLEILQEWRGNFRPRPGELDGVTKVDVDLDPFRRLQYYLLAALLVLRD